MTPERVRELASKGGKAARDRGTAHRWTTEEAKVVGRLGGLASTAAKKLATPPEGQEPAGQPGDSQA
jgi:general stress protein YciG